MQFLFVQVRPFLCLCNLYWEVTTVGCVSEDLPKYVPHYLLGLTFELGLCCCPWVRSSSNRQTLSSHSLRTFCKALFPNHPVSECSLHLLFRLPSSQQKVGHRLTEVNYEAAVWDRLCLQEACCRGDVKHTSSCLTSVSRERPAPHLTFTLAHLSSVGWTALWPLPPSLPQNQKKRSNDVPIAVSVPRITKSREIKSGKTDPYAGRLQTLRAVNN